jgi:hypothetical protein
MQALGMTNVSNISQLHKAPESIQSYKGLQIYRMHSRLYYVVNPESGEVIKVFRYTKVPEIYGFIDEFCKQNFNTEPTFSVSTTLREHGGLSKWEKTYIRTQMTHDRSTQSWNDMWDNLTYITSDELGVPRQLVLNFARQELGL